MKYKLIPYIIIDYVLVKLNNIYIYICIIDNWFNHIYI